MTDSTHQSCSCRVQVGWCPPAHTCRYLGGDAHPIGRHVSQEGSPHFDIWFEPCPLHTTVTLSNEDVAHAVNPKDLPIPHYQVRCPACGGLRRESDFRREHDPITDSDLVGQLFLGRGNIQTVDRLSYREALPEVAEVRAIWVSRMKKALQSLESVSQSGEPA